MTSNALALNTIDDTYRMAKGLVSSGLLPKSIKSNEQAFAIITLGQELGFAAWQSIMSIDVIQGKPTLKPQAMLALIHQSGLAEKIEIPDTEAIKKAQAATVTMVRKGGMAHTETFSWAMAQAMETSEWVNGNKTTTPLTAKYNWKTMPEIMMKWRAVSACARVVFPDVIMGMYTADEINADEVTPEEMTIVSATPILVTPQPQLSSVDAPAVEVEDAVEDAPRVEVTEPAYDPAKWDAASANAWFASREGNADFGSPTIEQLKNALGIKVKKSDFKGGGWDAADKALKAYMAKPADKRGDPVRDVDARLGSKGKKLATDKPEAVIETIIDVNEAEDAVIEDNIQDLAGNTPEPRKWYEPAPEKAKAAPAEAPEAEATPVPFKKDEIKELICEARVHMQGGGKNANSVCYSFPVMGDINTPSGEADPRIEWAEVWSRKVFEGTSINTENWPKGDPKVATDAGLWHDFGWSKKETAVFVCEFDGKGNWIIKGVK